MPSLMTAARDKRKERRMVFFATYIPCIRLIQNKIQPGHCFFSLLKLATKLQNTLLATVLHISFTLYLLL